MRGAEAAKTVGRALATCALAAVFLGAAPRQPRAFDDKIPYLKAARQGARERLGRPECQAVLSDFESVHGGRLDVVLRSTGRTAQEQLDQLDLQSGIGRPDCERGPVSAFTRVGSTAVSVCLSHFRGMANVQQEAILIHEMLHSLGLGENPPESVTITAQVMKRCAR